MKSLLIKNGRIIDPSRGWDGMGSILVADGKIVRVEKSNIPVPGNGCKVLDVQGMIVCPGFIDLHCHLREPGFEAKEMIATGTKAAACGGFTTVCCMPNTRPPIDSPATAIYIRKKAINEGVVRVLPVGCVTRGREGTELTDMEALAQAGVVAFSDDGDPVRNEEIMRRALVMSRKLGLQIVDHCEDPVGGPPEGEAKMVARDLKLAEEMGGWVHIAHVSTARSVELISAAKRKGVKVTAEVTPHHLTLTEEAIKRVGTLAKVNPPLRSEADRLAVVRALKEGVIDIVATDHAPHTAADKQTDFMKAASGISGFETALGSLMVLVNGGDLTMNELIHRLTIAPATILGGKFGQPGTLSAGVPADITIFDPDKEWVVDPEVFVSRGKNTPLTGVTLRGKVMATIVGGRVVYEDDTMVNKPGY
jgi:dihydroorotase